ncbi:MAG: hypothetical protein J1F36_05965 [Clostridiales bacterium]|nr:hypothetical protein [Clostridiales bacterium]
MFQFLLGVDSSREKWAMAIKDTLTERLDADCLVAATKLGKRYQVAVASESDSKLKILEIISDSVIEALGYFCKYEYLSGNLKLPLDPVSYNILLHALTQFDRSSDEALLKNCVQISNGMALDGIYRFRLGLLKERWREIVNLTKENAIYLTDSETFYELIKFLFSSIEARVENVILSKSNGLYIITDEADRKNLFSSADINEIVYALIDYAPLSIAVNKSFENEKTVDLITKIFGMQQLNSSVTS